ncbi:AraC family transcriptional regulator [uncultured Kiloniella sp.]|uniref:AraC family transcriptional regulator n=1 Tax=uncultured Kiloniella sp. TaxID=1133091 RepID=UPI0026099D1B|nr:AraC family transcriptional regulator [uncultured Kiloniella sp.]
MTIDHILEAIDINLNPFAFCEIRGASTTLALPDQNQAILHYITSGSGEIAISNRPKQKISTGTIILLPAHQHHSLISATERNTTLPLCRPLDASLEHLITGTGQQTLTAVCGLVDVSYRGITGLLNLIQTPLIAQLTPGDRIRNAMDELLLELANPTIGTKALAHSLLEQCVIMLVRRHHLEGHKSVEWLRGAEDRQMWDALQYILNKPQSHHTVESLADNVGMSRASFANKFKKIYGTTPIGLLRSIRLHRAAELLSATDLPIKIISSKVGYHSRSYFTKAFEIEFGKAPDHYRKTVRNNLDLT